MASARGTLSRGSKGSGGPGGGGGYNFQARATAFVYAHVLAGQPLSFATRRYPVPLAGWAESSGPGDDIRVECQGGVVVEIQAKLGLSVGEKFGEIPAVPALKATNTVRFSERYLDATITISAAAWLPLRTVARAYRQAQTKVMGGSGGKPPGLKNLTLFRFVTERIQPSSEQALQEVTSYTPKSIKASEGKRPVNEWNEAYPQWAYKTSVGDPNTRNFWRDYTRIRRTIAVGPRIEETMGHQYSNQSKRSDALGTRSHKDDQISVASTMVASEVGLEAFAP